MGPEENMPSGHPMPVRFRERPRNRPGFARPLRGAFKKDRKRRTVIRRFPASGMDIPFRSLLRFSAGGRGRRFRALGTAVGHPLRSRERFRGLPRCGLRPGGTGNPASLYRSPRYSRHRRSASAAVSPKGASPSTQWMRAPRRSMPRNQVICRLANWCMAVLRACTMSP